MDKQQLQNKIRGSITGGAIGDALGYPIEFVYSFNDICARYGKEGITDFDMSYPWLESEEKKGLFSDDTQMTLYTAEGLLEAERNGKPIAPTVCNAYLAWYAHQAGRKVKISYQSKLSEIEELNQNRAPGNTCLSALAAIHAGKEPQNASKGCGGIMRVAPVGLYGAAHDWSPADTARLSGELAELTHLHPLSTYSSATLAVIVQLCASSEDAVDKEMFKGIVDKSLKIVSDVYGADAAAMDEFRKIVGNAMSLEDDPQSDWQIIEDRIGEGWVAEETLAIALFSTLRHVDDFTGCLISAVNHGGDSDSTGAVAGNIIGAILGDDAIPGKFKKEIQLRDLLLHAADDLAK